MNYALKSAIHAALLGGMAAVAAGSAQGQYAPLGGAYTTGDAIAGFTTGSGSELVVNLGPISSLTNGEQWNLATLLGPGTGNAGFVSLNNLNWGVIGISGGNYYSTVVFNPAAKGNPSSAGDLTTHWGYLNQSQVSAASSADSWYNNVDTPNSGDTTSPYATLGNSADTTTPASGTFTFSQNSAAWYQNGTALGAGAQTVGFSFSSDGVLAFTNLASVVTPPSPQIVSIDRSGNTSTIYFTTTNGFNYTLYYTNSAGLTAPVSTWPSSSTTVAGNGTTTNLSDTTTDPYRFYRIGVH